jgi:AP-1 complex subunit beta-1
MNSLPPALLEQLLNELSTLASVYHKPPETFVGHGRYGADAIQHAAIQEARQNAVDNPIAAAVVAAQNGTQNNAENLLDIDFDGAAPASADAPPMGGASGLEGLGGTPQRVASPTVGAPTVPASSMDDMMGLFDTNGSSSGASAVQNDMMNGFAGLDLSGASHPPPPQHQLGGGKKTNEDLLGMF